MMAQFQRAAVEQGVDAAKELYFQSLVFERARAIPGVSEPIRAALHDYSGWHWFHEDRGRALDPPAIARLGDIRVPTLVIVGEYDLPDFRAIADTLARGIPGARLEVLDGVGHCSNVEAPGRFNSLLLEFLDGLPVGGAAAAEKGRSDET